MIITLNIIHLDTTRSSHRSGSSFYDALLPFSSLSGARLGGFKAGMALAGITIARVWLPCHVEGTMVDAFIWTWVSFQHLFSLVMVILGLVLAAQLLRSERSPGATMAWLLFIILIPYVGIPLFIMLGGRKIRLTKKHKSIYQKIPDRKILLEHSMLERVLLSSGAPESQRQQNFKWLSDGEAAFFELIKLIESAQHEIILTTYIFTDDETGRAVLNSLCLKSKAGVKVGLLIDSLLANRRTRLMLKDVVAAGGSVSYFMPLFHWPSQRRANLRNHRKSVIVDGARAFIGGMNIAHEYMGPTPDPKRWDDLSLRIDGPAAWDLRQIFLSDWSFSTRNPWHSSKLEPAKPGQAGLAQVLASGPDVDTDTLYEALLTMAYNAKSIIQIVTPYFLPDESLTKALESAAKRGVLVHVIMPKASNHPITDFARTTTLHSLARAGAKIFYIPHMIHAKAILVDDMSAVVGSANFDMRSLFLNFELGVFLFSKNELDWVRDWMNRLQAIAFRDHTLVNKPISIWNGVGRMLSPFL